MKHRVFANSVNVLFSEDRGTGFTRDNLFVFLSVSAQDGLVEIRQPKRGDRYMEALDWLQEEEYAVLRPIGPEDSELFATPRLLAIVGDALKALPRHWQEFESEGAEA